MTFSHTLLEVFKSQRIPCESEFVHVLRDYNLLLRFHRAQLKYSSSFEIRVIEFNFG